MHLVAMLEVAEEASEDSEKAVTTCRILDYPYSSSQSFQGIFLSIKMLQ